MYDFYKEPLSYIGADWHNVIAVVSPTKENYPDASIRLYARMFPEGFGALYDKENSVVASTGFSPEYIKKCKRITEEEARKLHPALFKRIDE